LRYPQPPRTAVGLVWSAQRHESVVAAALIEAIRDVDVAGQPDSVLDGISMTGEMNELTGK
jgi:hypothetical protein